MFELFEKIHEIQEAARTNLIKAKQRSKIYYDKRMNPVTFNINDNVFLINKKKKDKFDKEYLGPYKIIETLDNENVKIRIGKTTRVVHVNLRKSYYGEPG